MTEISAMKNKTWVKNVTINNRKFKISIYRDEWNFLWFRVEEILRQKKNFMDFGYKKEICCLWTEKEETIIEQALAKIDKLFEEENRTKRVEKALDKFADYIV